MFATVSFVFLLYWHVTWTNKAFKNITVKYLFALMASWAAFEALTYWGYVVHV